MVNIANKYSQVHNTTQNNNIIGDFNVSEKDIDKGKGMAHRDTMMNSKWEELKSETAIVDPFRVQYPKNVHNLFYRQQCG